MPISPLRIATPLLALALALAAGCRGPNTAQAPDPATPDPVSAAAYPQIVALEDLGDYVSTDRPIVTRAPGQPLSVVVPVRLRSDREVSAQYRFIFFDDAGRPTRQQQEWRFTTLPARSQIFLEGAALDPQAQDWRLEIRPAR